MSRPSDFAEPKSGDQYTQTFNDCDSKNVLDQITDRVDSTRSEDLPTPKRNDLIRFFKLQAVAPFKSWRSPTEYRKIALHWSHRIAVGHALLHFLPLCGAITLLILNWSQYFVGSSFHSSTALQFVAKLLELFMQTSIAEIILSIVRTQILQGYIPLGALSATTQTSHISYLWSLDFFAAITSHAFHGWRKCFFLILVPLLIILTALVGPSGATLMIPRPGSSSRQSNVYWSTRYSPDFFFPSRLDYKQNLTFDIDAFKNTYSLTPKNYVEYTNTQAYTNKKDDRLWRTGLRMLRYKSIAFKQLMATATIPTQLSLQILNDVNIDVGSNETASVDLPRPVVRVNCGFSPTPNASSPITYFLDDGRSTATIPSIMDLFQQYIDRNGSTEAQVNSLPPLWNSSSEPGSSSYIFNFIEDLCAGAGNPNWSSPRISYLYENPGWSNDNCFSVLTCSLTANWEMSKHEVIGNDDGFRLVRTAPLPKGGPDRSENQRPISVNWDSCSPLKTAEFNAMVRKANLVNDIVSLPSVVLAVSIATIISELDWQIQRQDVDLSGRPYQFIVTKTTYGWGYGTSTMASRLSLFIITIYCIVTVAYMTYIVVSGHTSVAWNSAAELIVLGLQSARPEHLTNTSVGINSINTYKESVGIRVNDSNRIELVFENDSGNAVRRLRKVMPNRAY